MAKVELQPQRK